VADLVGAEDCQPTSVTVSKAASSGSCETNPAGGEAYCAKVAKSIAAQCAAVGRNKVTGGDGCVSEYDCHQSNCPCFLSCTNQCDSESCMEQCMAKGGQDYQAVGTKCSSCGFTLADSFICAI
jgi:hypothetical protein